MEVAQEKLDLISKIIKSDRKFSSNEDMYEDFFNEAYKRSVKIINAIESTSTLEIYLRKVVSSAIVTVLKDSGRLQRSRAGYMSTTSSVLAVDSSDIDYSSVSINYSSVNIPENPEDVVIQKEILEFIADTVIKLDKEEPDKKYLHIYTLRYDKGMTQNEISEELGLSQSEVSKRLFKLMEKVRSVIQ